MPIEDSEQGLIIRQEGPNVRALSGSLNILFPKSQRDAVLSTYREWEPKVRAHFEPRWKEYSGATLTEAEFRALVREITLHWMGYFVMQRIPVEIAAEHLDHPQTRRIIRAAVEQRFPRGSDQAVALCAQLTGLTADQFRKWAEADESFLGMM